MKENLFIKQVIALLKGEKDEVIAIKIQKKVAATFKTEIAASKAKLLELEDSLEEAKEVYQKAFVNNGELSFDKDSYLNILIDARNKVVDAEEAIAAKKDIITFFEEQLKEVE